MLMLMLMIVCRWDDSGDSAGSLVAGTTSFLAITAAHHYIKLHKTILREKSLVRQPVTHSITLLFSCSLIHFFIYFSTRPSLGLQLQRYFHFFTQKLPSSITFYLVSFIIAAICSAAVGWDAMPYYYYTIK